MPPSLFSQGRGWAQEREAFSLLPSDGHGCSALILSHPGERRCNLVWTELKYYYLLECLKKCIISNSRWTVFGFIASGKGRWLHTLWTKLCPSKFALTSQHTAYYGGWSCLLSSRSSQRKGGELLCAPGYWVETHGRFGTEWSEKGPRTLFLAIRRRRRRIGSPGWCKWYFSQGLRIHTQLFCSEKVFVITQPQLCPVLPGNDNLLGIWQFSIFCRSHSCTPAF